MDILATRARLSVQIEARNKLLSDREKKFIKAFRLKIPIFDFGVSISSCKVTNLEDKCKQRIETEFHQRVGAFKPLDKSNEEESGLNIRESMEAVVCQIVLHKLHHFDNDARINYLGCIS